MPNTVFLLKLSAFSPEPSDLPIRYMQRSECFTGNKCLKQGIGRKECRKGMFHGKHMFRREHFRFVQRHCSTAKIRRIKRRLRRVKLKQKLFSYYSVCIDGDAVR